MSNDGGNMLEARRPMGRLFYLLPFVLAALLVSQAQTPPATTTINDIVYRADGTPAGGTLLISWPAFNTSGGQAVAAGTKSVAIGTAGALNVALVPNTGASPAATYYTVVYRLDDGTVKTEYWVVPTTSPTTIAAVRTVLGSPNSASQLASRQYVDTVLASKANDAAVVHTSGSETIAGTKQFAIPPSVPAPALPSDAVNKAYVDAAVGNAGGGSFVSKAGDTMLGPLTLPADPVAPNQAANRHYVDTGMAAKADLLGGMVPTSELGNGTTNGTLCLKGDSTWGACGTSSNAVSIQNVPVDTTTPADSQVITFDAASGKYKPKPGGGVSAGMQATKYALDFNWSQTPTADLSTPGSKTVSLTACPPGVTGTEPWYYIYVSGTGMAEAVLVTGGTCSGNSQPGTLQFTTANAHSAGYTVSSASGGLQEALIAARFTPTNPATSSQAGKVIVPPGEYKAYARVSVRSSNITVDFSGSIVECWMNDVCIFTGDPVNTNLFLNITLVNPRGRPMVAYGTQPFIEDNAQQTRILNISTRNSGVTGGSFGTYVRVDNDQAFLLDGLVTNLGYGVRCDATYCGAFVTAPGPFGLNAAVGWLKNMNISAQCSANGVDWESGNSVHISDSVIQGFPQYGVKTGTLNGGYNGSVLDNVYMEVGNCTNPLGAIGEMGILSHGAPITFHSTNPGTQAIGQYPSFANTGGTIYLYYAVIHDTTTGGVSAPYVFGLASTNGSGSIPLSWPKVTQGTDTITYDILRTTFGTLPTVSPYGTGNYAVITNVAQCTGAVCGATDTQAALASYTVSNQTYAPVFAFWPGGLILTGGATAFMDHYAPNIYNGSLVVSTSGMNSPTVYATKCYGATASGNPLYVSCLGTESSGNNFPQLSSTIMQFGRDSSIGTSGLKGRLIFEKNAQSAGENSTHIITLIDSDPAKTAAYGNNRPPYDANDMYIGLDNTSGFSLGLGQARLAFGAPASISHYIGNAGDGTNWLERLTSNLKEFKTNVQMDASLTVTGAIHANSFVTNGTWSAQGGYSTLDPAPAGQSLIGFGTNGKVQVSENGGAIVELAKLDSNGNVAENANSATQLAQTPTQCNGSFAVGVQANGNANCATPDIIQLAETAPPAGIANYGIFWFDQTCHCPKVISNNGQAVQLGLMNMFNFDANTVEEYNGTTPQTFRLYSTRTDASNYERFGLKWDNTDGYFTLASENAGTGSQRGIAFWIGNNVRWAIDTASTLKPFTDNSFNIGSTSLRPKTIYAGTSVITPAVISPNVVNMANRTAAFASTNLLASAPIGQYEVSVYMESDVACSTPGPASASVTLGWGDRTGARSMTVPLVGNGTSSGVLTLGSTANFGQAVMTIWNNSTSNNITYSTNYTACTTGTGTYALYIALRQVQ